MCVRSYSYVSIFIKISQSEYQDFLPGIIHMTNVSWNISDWEEETFFYQTVGAAFRSNCLPAQLFPSARPHSNLFITPKQVDEVQVGRGEASRRRHDAQRSDE
jgi:hypothetical protein